MHVCLTIADLSKRSGGPTSVVLRLSEHLVQAGVSVSIMTHEIGHGDSEALPRDERVRVIHVSLAVRGAWQSALGRVLQKTGEQGANADSGAIVHDFGIWMASNHAVASACSQFRIPRVCSPSGMLAPWALRHKAWKKRMAWWLYQRGDLRRATLLAATSQQEAEDIRRMVPGKDIALVPNGVEMPWEEEQRAEDRGRRTEDGGLSAEVRGQRSVDSGRNRTAVFLGRIHGVKGLMNLVQAWHLARPAGWRCIIAGPDQAGHQAELETVIRARNLGNEFEFPGMVENERKWSLLKQADLFLLPSFTENFGIAAAEALACAVPVIATKGTPWKDLEEHRCGWWVDIGVEPLADALRKATALSDSERQEMGQRGRQLACDKYSWSRIASEMRSVYDWLLGTGGRPACVQQGHA